MSELTADSAHRSLASRRDTAVATAAAGATMLLVTVVTLLVRVGGLDRRERERGDVPGWVLITLMTAGLVTVLWKVAGDQLEKLFATAIASVTGPGK